MSAPKEHLSSQNNYETQLLVAGNLSLETVFKLVGGIPNRNLAGMQSISWEKTLQRNRRKESSKIEIIIQDPNKKIFTLSIQVGSLSTNITDFGVIINNKDKYLGIIDPYSTQNLLFGFLITQNGIEYLRGPSSTYNPDFLKTGQFAASQLAINNK